VYHQKYVKRKTMKKKIVLWWQRPSILPFTSVVDFEKAAS